MPSNDTLATNDNLNDLSDNDSFDWQNADFLATMEDIPPARFERLFFS